VIGQYKDALDDRKDELYGSFSLRRAVVIDQASVISCLLCSVYAAVPLCRKKSFNQLNMSFNHCETLAFFSKISIRGTEVASKTPRINVTTSRVQSLTACGPRGCLPAKRKVKSKTEWVNWRTST
jgi:hypothetical protein